MKEILKRLIAGGSNLSREELKEVMIQITREAYSREEIAALLMGLQVKGIAAEELADYPGAGAAGGLGYAFLAYLDAELRPGIDILLDIADFDALLRDADLVITGEGRSDAQTLMGKLPYGVLQRCRIAGVSLWLLSGAIDTAAEELSHSFSLVSSINENDPRPLPELLQPERAMENLKRTVSYCLKEYSW